MGGLKGVIITDFFQFIIAMVGSIWAAIYIVNLPEIGGMTELINNPLVKDSINFLPDFNNPESYVPIFIIPLAVQWWSTWYPGAEPGGGGYIVQRMLSAKDERNATFATLFFNIAHYALRPWPWIVIALATLVIYPKVYNAENTNQLKIDKNAFEILSSQNTVEEMEDAKATFFAGSDHVATAQIEEVYFYAMANLLKVKSNPSKSAKDQVADVKELIPLQLAAPNVTADKIGHDLSYPLMIKSLPKGLLGLVLASLMAAFMSTISTHLNWGSSYVVNDLYKRFINPKASEKQLVGMGRISIILMMILASVFTLFINEAKEGFDLLLNIGAGTGLLFILRWFWFRINAVTEIVAMVVSFVMALLLYILEKSGVDLGLKGHEKMILVLSITTVSWVLTALLTKPTKQSTLDSFKKRAFGDKTPLQGMGYKFLGMLAAVFGVYSALFSVGSFIYGKSTQGFYLLAVSMVCWMIIIIGRKKILA
jgi:Na+/proline symporter